MIRIGFRALILWSAPFEDITASCSLALTHVATPTVAAPPPHVLLRKDEVNLRGHACSLSSANSEIDEDASSFGWEQYADAAGTPYYYSARTGVTQYDDPRPGEGVSIAEAPPHVAADEEGGGGDVAGWATYSDESRMSYFHAASTI